MTSIKRPRSEARPYMPVGAMVTRGVSITRLQRRFTMMFGDGAMGDFGFQTGEWRVRHRKLKDRLTGSTEWVEFAGTCRAFEVMAGEANVEDNFLDDPAGAYRAAAFRRRARDTGQWSIWWHDGRNPGSADPPVVGAFKDGVGEFFAEDMLDERPIRVRFVWSEITAMSARWEQAFSADDGETWEVNWVMRFERVG